MTRFSGDDVRAACKARDTWWTVLLVDPLACRLTLVIANRTRLTPNQLTCLGFAIALGAAACFTQGTWPWLVAGAALYHLSFVIDCVDGKVARLKENGSILGGWLDYTLDRVRAMIAIVALTGGQYAATGRVEFLFLALGLLIVNGVRYANNPRVVKARGAMNSRLGRRARELDELDGLEVAEPRRARIDLHKGFRLRYPGYLRVRAALRRRRINPHLVGGIEYEMLMLVVAPLLGPSALIPAFLVVAPFRLVFEAVLVYRLWLSNKDYVQAEAALDAELDGRVIPDPRVGQEAAWTSSTRYRE